MKKLGINLLLVVMLIFSSVLTTNAEGIDFTKLKQYDLNFETHFTDLLGGKDTIKLSSKDIDQKEYSPYTLSINNKSKDGTYIDYTETQENGLTVLTLEINVEDDILPLLYKDQVKIYNDLKISWDALNEKYNTLSEDEKSSTEGIDLKSQMRALDKEFRKIMSTSLTFTSYLTIDEKYMTFQTNDYYSLTGESKGTVKLYENPWAYNDTRNIMRPETPVVHDASKGHLLELWQNLADSTTNNNFIFRLHGEDVEIDRITAHSKWKNDIVVYNQEDSFQDEGFKEFWFSYWDEDMLSFMGDESLKEITRKYKVLEEENYLKILADYSSYSKNSVELSKELYDYTQYLNQLVEEHISFTFDFENSKGQNASFSFKTLKEIREMDGFYFNFPENNINLNVLNELKDVNVNYNENAFNDIVHRILIGTPSIDDDAIQKVSGDIGKKLGDQKEVSHYYAFSISPQNKDFKKIQLAKDGKVEFSMQLPDGFDSKKLIQVYHLNSDGSYDLLESSLKGNILSFIINSFSDFIIVEADSKVIEAPKPTPQPELKPEAETKPEVKPEVDNASELNQEILPETGIEPINHLASIILAIGLIIVNKNRVLRVIKKIS